MRVCVALGIVVYATQHVGGRGKQTFERTARVDNINSVVVKTKQPECMLLLQGTWDMAAHRLPKLGLRRSDNPLDMRAPGRHNTLIQAKTLVFKDTTPTSL